MIFQFTTSRYNLKKYASKNISDAVLNGSNLYILENVIFNYTK